MPRKRRRQSSLPDVPTWDQRTITLIGDRSETLRICDEWRAEGWQVMAIDLGPPTAAGDPTHVVRVAVPPPGWVSGEQVLHRLEAEG
jgi:hypothetical protein